MSFDRAVGVWGFIIGLLGTAFSIWAYADSRQLAQVTYNISHETVYRPSQAISTNLSLPGNSYNTSDRVVQTIVTVWNGGSVPLKGVDTRSKLSISGDSSVSILDHKTVLTKILPGSDGFTVSLIEKRIEIDWRIFDPGEAIQIVLLSTGNSGSIDLSGRFLPGQEIVRFPVRSGLKTAAIVMCFIGAIVTAVILFSSIIPFVKSATSSRFVAGILVFATFLVVAITYGYVGYRVLNSARSSVGDISPIDPYLTYINVDRKLDYRYVPM